MPAVRTNPATSRGSFGTAATGKTSSGSTRAAARACAPAPSGTAFNADVYDCEAITKEHLDSFWLEPRIESGSLKKCDTLDELAEAMGFDADQAATFKGDRRAL